MGPRVERPGDLAARVRVGAFALSRGCVAEARLRPVVREAPLVVEILAGMIVLITPRFGGLLVAAWLAGIILSLVLVGGYGDIALRT